MWSRRRNGRERVKGTGATTTRRCRHDWGLVGGGDWGSSWPETAGRCFMQSPARGRREGVGERPRHPPQLGRGKGHQGARIGGSLAWTTAAHPPVRHTRQRALRRRRASQHPAGSTPAVSWQGGRWPSTRVARPERAARGLTPGPWRARRPVTSENIVCVRRGQRAKQLGWRRRRLYSSGSPRWDVRFFWFGCKANLSTTKYFSGESSDYVAGSNIFLCLAYSTPYQQGCLQG